MSKEKAELEVFETIMLGTMARLPEESRHEIEMLITELRSMVDGVEEAKKMCAVSMLYIEVMKENV